jgi:hypothetical protein
LLCVGVEEISKPSKGEKRKKILFVVGSLQLFIGIVCRILWKSEETNVVGTGIPGKEV